MSESFSEFSIIIFVYFTRPSFHGLGLTMKMWTEAKGEEEAEAAEPAEPDTCAVWRVEEDEAEGERPPLRLRVVRSRQHAGSRPQHHHDIHNHLCQGLLFCRHSLDLFTLAGKCLCDREEYSWHRTRERRA